MTSLGRVVSQAGNPPRTPVWSCLGCLLHVESNTTGDFLIRPFRPRTKCKLFDSILIFVIFSLARNR